MPFPNPYTALATQLKRQLGSTALNVNREAITLGSRNATTGWRAITYAETSVEMIVLPRNQGLQLFPPGFYPRYGYAGFSTTAFIVGDQEKDAANNYYLVESAVPYKAGGATILFYAYDLKQLNLWQAQTGATTWSLTRPNDPRQRQKVWIDTYARVAQITKDNDSTQATWAAIFNDPPYPLALEFRAASSPVQGLYVVDQPNSTPLIGHDKVAFGYNEHVPIHICTVDSTACSGWALAWKMEAELRYICETQPLGSVRGLERRSKQDRDLGGMWLYDTEYIMEYTRDTT